MSRRVGLEDEVATVLLSSDDVEGVNSVSSGGGEVWFSLSKSMDDSGLLDVLAAELGVGIGNANDLVDPA